MRRRLEEERRPTAARTRVPLVVLAAAMLGQLQCALADAWFAKDILWTAPEDKANERKQRPVPIFLDDRTAEVVGDVDRLAAMDIELERLQGAEHLGSSSTRTLLTRFLHVSDAQVRDELLYGERSDRSELDKIDAVLPDTRRPLSVESYDSLTLAAFLLSYGRERARDPDGGEAFVIHTGDLLDLSVATEAIEAIGILRDVARIHPHVPIRLVAGNHDGHAWGTLPDVVTVTQGLGINKSEFVLGCLLLGADSGGFGFEANEIYQRFRVGGNPLGSHSDERRRDFADDVEKASKSIRDVARLDRRELRHTATMREAVEVGAAADTSDLRLGYFSWIQGTAEDLPDVRMIVLDTRTNRPREFWLAERIDDRYQILHKGSLDDVQLGWLHRELTLAVAERQLVFLFSHHALDELEDSTKGAGEALEAMLDAFPNVVAAFHGHTHENAVRTFDGTDLPLIETGSITDYPRTAREVAVFVSPAPSGHWEVEIHSAHVRAQVTSDGSDASAHCRRALEASLEDARKDLADKRLRALEEQLTKSPITKTTAHLPDPVHWSASGESLFGRSHWRRVRLDRSRLGLVDPRPGPREPEPWYEASAVAVLGDLALVGRDDTFYSLFAYDLTDAARREVPVDEGLGPFDDIEALAAWDSERVFVVCSQGRSREEEHKRDDRRRLALLRVDVAEGGPILSATDVGLSDLRRHLLRHLKTWAQQSDRPEAWPAWNDLGSHGPEQGGLSVQGAVRWGDTLLLGLESPRLTDRALIVPLVDPLSLRDGDGSQPAFGDVWEVPIELHERIEGLARLDDELLVLLGRRPPTREGMLPSQLDSRVVAWRPDGGTPPRTVAVDGLERFRRCQGIDVHVPTRRLVLVQDLFSRDPGPDIVVVPLFPPRPREETP